MKIDIRYSIHIDLVFHVLAYFHVNNASDLFDQAYIDRLHIEKAAYKYDLFTEVSALEKYYNDNFERLGYINFLPFYSGSFDELKEIFLNCNRFTAQDKTVFIEPFIRLLENEAFFYFQYWQNNYDKMVDKRELAEKRLTIEMNKYTSVFDYCNKSVAVYYSSSISRNGRGFGNIESYFSAIIPFPKNEDDFDYSFFTLLHEYTHLLTDVMLKRNINMTDGSHLISETLVVLADYYLVKTVDSSAIKKYFKWIAKVSRNEDIELTESEFLMMFHIDADIEARLKELLSNMLMGQEGKDMIMETI